MQKYKKKIDEILRVNHAGEYGAQVIYKSQIRHSKNKKLKKELEKISQDEIVHFEYFNEMILKTEFDQQLCSLCGWLEARLLVFYPP